MTIFTGWEPGIGIALLNHVPIAVEFGHIMAINTSVSRFGEVNVGFRSGANTQVSMAAPGDMTGHANINHIGGSDKFVV